MTVTFLHLTFIIYNIGTSLYYTLCHYHYKTGRPGRKKGHRIFLEPEILILELS